MLQCTYFQLLLNKSSISSAEGKAVDDETLTQKSKLNMQGALAEQVVTPTPIGEILVTLQE